MISRSFRVALSAFLFVGALGLASTGPVQAQSIMKQCRDQKEGAAAPAAAPAAVPVSAPAPAPVAPAPMQTYQPKPKPMQAARATGAGEFSSEAQAKGRCPGDTVVWVNTKGKSHTYHYSGTRWYGTTKQGAYMCEADAGAAGYHASKSKTEQQKQM